nr:hypothetical protein [Hoyosella altamirensis]
MAHADVTRGDLSANELVAADGGQGPIVVADDNAGVLGELAAWRIQDHITRLRLVT